MGVRYVVPIWTSVDDESKTGQLRAIRTVPITCAGVATLTDIAFRLMAAPSSAETVERTDLEKHDFAQYILQEHGMYFPKWARADMAVLGNAHNHADSRI